MACRIMDMTMAQTQIHQMRNGYQRAANTHKSGMHHQVVVNGRPQHAQPNQGQARHEEQQSPVTLMPFIANPEAENTQQRGKTDKGPFKTTPSQSTQAYGRQQRNDKRQQCAVHGTDD